MRDSMNFFSDVPGIFHFRLFGFWHIVLTITMLLAMVLIYKYQEALRKWKYHDKAFRYIVAGIMFTNMAIYYGQKILDGTWSYKEHLPLHFCFISGYLFMYALVTNHKSMFKFVYFFSFAGPLPAILLPDLTCGPDRFIFWQFFFSHHFFLTASIYVLYVLEWKITYLEAFKAFIAANIIFALVFGLNQVIGSNYIMTTNLPAHIMKLFPFLSYINIPILWLELAGIAACFIAFIPLFFLYRSQESSKDSSILHQIS